ncbi:formylglycine-generating enzyme family protein [Spirillospora sp. NPDC127200]
MDDSTTSRIGAVQLVDADINALTDRAAMGLPEHYVPPRAEHVRDAAEDLRTDQAVLASRMTDAVEPLERRLAAGTLLALAGDPRIKVLDPPMAELPAASCAIGTDVSEVEELYRDAARFGVRRDWVEKECPRHRVRVDAFRIGVYPVTNAEYAKFLSETELAQLPSAWDYGRFHPATANHPVYTVTAEAADAYTVWLSARTGRRFRLPTEAEWEYAAGGAQGRRYPWGAEWREDHANTLETGLLGTTPVGAFPQGASWCGALDMAGNVEEYVSDRYHPHPGGEIVHDDLFKRMGHYRLAKGGAFNRFRDLGRNQRRHGPYPRSLYAMGFRLAESLPVPGSG